MTKKLLFVSAVLLAMVFAAVAADSITGKWTFEQPMMGRGGPGGGPGGGAPGGGAPGGAAMPPRTVTLDLKASGETLTGTILQPAMGGRRGGGDAGAQPPAPTPTEIKNGKVNGNNISFDVTRESQMGAMTTKYEGTVSGSEMKLKITRPGFQGGDPVTSEVTAKKAN